MKEKTVERCAKCGFRLRGKHHTDGVHHGKTRPGVKMRTKFKNDPDVHKGEGKK